MFSKFLVEKNNSVFNSRWESHTHIPHTQPPPDPAIHLEKIYLKALEEGRQQKNKCWNSYGNSISVHAGFHAYIR